MSLPKVVSEQEWLEARQALLAEEKAMTRARDALSTKRRELPMVEVTKDDAFTGPEGRVGLVDLFDGRRQLIVQHFMFDPEWDDGCPSCTAASDELCPGLIAHLNTRDTSLAVVSRAPLEKLERYKAKRGWTFPWYSSNGSNFNYDYHVTIDASVAPVMFNYRTLPELEATGAGWLGEGSSEQPGYSCFLRDHDSVFHTYSAFARGTEALGGSYYFLDMTALGRQEEWEEPKGRADDARGERSRLLDVSSVWRDRFVEWFDYYAARASERLTGLDNSEYMWEPVGDCWNVRPAARGGGFALDGFARDGDGPDPDPAPVTTIAWRLVHVSIGCFDHPLRTVAFGVERVPVVANEIPGTAAAALAFFDRACATWRADLVSLTDTRLSEPLGPGAGPYARDPVASYVEHMHDELIHHTAEIALLRDLYRAGGGASSTLRP